MFTEPQTTAETAQLRKFMFERSFDTSTPRAPERKPVTLKPDQYDALKQESYDQGFAAGHQTGLDEQVAHFTALMSVVENKMDTLIGNLESIQKLSNENARAMALAIARKFVPEFTARHGLQEIETLLSSVVSEMIHEPRLVVRVHDLEFDVLNEKIGTLAAKKAYAGKIVVLADAGIAAGDCLIEWADGGMERNAAATWSKIENVVTP